MTRIGELFAGYGGLGMAVQQVYGGELAWYSEFDAAPSRIMAHHHPGVPNHGDITAIRWADVEPVDILTGGFPCQDVSVAGRRAGMTEGTRSGLWSYMRTAIDQLRPGLVVIENVGGLFSAQANSFVEPCPYGLGDAGGGGHTVLLRAADAVLGDLASLGYDAEWVALRASDVGAPHGRLRVFITAHPSCGRGGGRTAGPEPARSHDAPLGPDPRGDRGRDHHGLTLLPTPGANLGENGGPQHPDKRRAGGHSVSIEDAVHGLSLLPTPRATDGTKGGPNQRGSSGDRMLPSAVAQLLPTPTAQAAKHAGDDRGPGTLDDHNLWAVVTRRDHFGPYTPAIHRWEQVMGRPAPAPTEPGKTRPRLSARFVEWMMGLPDDHVTNVPGLTRNQQLKALGNGVVPQQGAAALTHLHHVRKAA